MLEPAALSPTLSLPINISRSNLLLRIKIINLQRKRTNYHLRPLPRTVFIDVALLLLLQYLEMRIEKKLNLLFLGGV